MYLAVLACVVVSLVIAAAGDLGIQSFWSAVANWFIALAAGFFAFAVVPNFQINRIARIAAAIFFVTLAMRSLGTMFTYLFDTSPETFKQIQVWYFAPFASAQAMTIWLFLLGIRQTQNIERDRIVRLRGTPERGRRSTDDEHPRG